MTAGTGLNLWTCPPDYPHYDPSGRRHDDPSQPGERLTHDASGVLRATEAPAREGLPRSSVRAILADLLTDAETLSEDARDVFNAATPATIAAAAIKLGYIEGRRDGLRAAIRTLDR